MSTTGNSLNRNETVTATNPRQGLLYLLWTLSGVVGGVRTVGAASNKSGDARKPSFARPISDSNNGYERHLPITECPRLLVYPPGSNPPKLILFPSGSLQKEDTVFLSAIHSANT